MAPHPVLHPMPEYEYVTQVVMKSTHKSGENAVLSVGGLGHESLIAEDRRGGARERMQMKVATVNTVNIVNEREMVNSQEECCQERPCLKSKVLVQPNFKSRGANLLRESQCLGREVDGQMRGSQVQEWAAWGKAYQG